MYIGSLELQFSAMVYQNLFNFLALDPPASRGRGPTKSSKDQTFKHSVNHLPRGLRIIKNHQGHYHRNTRTTRVQRPVFNK